MRVFLFYTQGWTATGAQGVATRPTMADQYDVTPSGITTQSGGVSADPCSRLLQSSCRRHGKGWDSCKWTVVSKNEMRLCAEVGCPCGDSACSIYAPGRFWHGRRESSARCACDGLEFPPGRHVGFRIRLIRCTIPRVVRRGRRGPGHRCRPVDGSGTGPGRAPGNPVPGSSSRRRRCWARRPYNIRRGCDAGGRGYTGRSSLRHPSRSACGIPAAVLAASVCANPGFSATAIADWLASRSTDPSELQVLRWAASVAADVERITAERYVFGAAGAWANTRNHHTVYRWLRETYQATSSRPR